MQLIFLVLTFGVNFFRYAAIQIQEFDIEMESNFLLQTLLFVDDINRHLDKRNGIDKEVALLKGKQDRMLYLSQTSLNRYLFFDFTSTICLLVPGARCFILKYYSLILSDLMLVS